MFAMRVAACVQLRVLTQLLANLKSVARVIYATRSLLRTARALSSAQLVRCPVTAVLALTK
jgi:hypothetical protein